MIKNMKQQAPEVSIQVLDYEEQESPSWSSPAKRSREVQSQASEQHRARVPAEIHTASSISVNQIAESP